MAEIAIKVVERPWGMFRQFIQNTPATVKIIHVKGGEQLSLQKHDKRNEFWRVLSGTPKITIGDTVSLASPGEEYQVPLGANHRLEAPAGDIEILEIALGEFDEEDITRLEDKYGRA